MEQCNLAEVEDELAQIDVDSMKLDAVIQLKGWQKKMHALVDRTYKSRLEDINGIALDRASEIKDHRRRIPKIDQHDQHLVQQFKNEVNALKSDIVVLESIPENFDRRIERTVRIQTDGEEEDDDAFEEEEEDEDDDAPVIVDFEKDHKHSGDRVTVLVAAAPPHPEGTVSRVFNSQPIQHALAVSLVKAMAQMGTIAATSTTTVAATTMAKTAMIATACGIGTVAYGVGRIAMGTTRKIYSLVVSSE